MRYVLCSAVYTYDQNFGLWIALRTPATLGVLVNVTPQLGYIQAWLICPTIYTMLLLGIPDISRFWYNTALLRSVKVHQKVDKFVTK